MRPLCFRIFVFCPFVRSHMKKLLDILVRQLINNTGILALTTRRSRNAFQRLNELDMWGVANDIAWFNVVWQLL